MRALPNRPDMREEDLDFARVRVNEQGRIVLPAALRCKVGISPRDTVVVKLVGDHLEVVTNAALLARLRAAIGPLHPGVLPSDQLVAERRLEAQREDAEYAPPIPEPPLLTQNRMTRDGPRVTIQ